MDVLQVQGLCKSYDKFALRDVTFSVPEGCIAGFIGANGAGKTTTLRSVLGLARPSAGRIRLFGMDAEKNEKEIKDRIGVVFDDGQFYTELTLKEMKNVLSPAYSSWSEQDFSRWMDRFELSQRQKISSLSRGMRMKFALALALSHKAEFLLMDEPTSGLDPQIRNEFLDVLAGYMEHGGRGVLFSTHITSDLDKVADTLIMIDRGRIVFQEDKDVLMESYRSVRGDTAALNEEIRPLFMKITEGSFGFTGITKEAERVRRLMPGALIEKVSVEDIMLANLGKEAPQPVCGHGQEEKEETIYD